MMLPETGRGTPTSTGGQTEADAPLRYVIDAADRIVHVNAAWSASAAVAGDGRLTVPAIIGRSLWDGISDSTTRHLYEAMLARVRTGGPPVELTFRCDTPASRRLMHLCISALEAGGVSFEVRLIATWDRLPVGLLQPGAARTDDLVRMCSWCKRIPLDDGRWVEVEDAMRVLDLLDTPPFPAITHGMCPACFAAVTAAMDAPGEMEAR